jgi:hypothetical protein
MHTVMADLRRPDTKPSPPNISTRAFIQWLPDPPSEPTSTEVLTSRERFFVDIRILKGEAEDNSPSPLSTNIDWAFAGRSESRKDDATGRTLTTWSHTIDSRFPAHPESVVDQAEMLPEDPETGIALEKGSMVNPATGKETAYVEGWRETKILHVPELSRNHLEGFEDGFYARGLRFVGGDPDLSRSARHGNQPGETGLISCVLQHEDAARQSRGMVIRVGQFCQGVLRVGDEFAVERWERTLQPGWLGWRRVFACGSKLNMPCDVACYLAIHKLRVGSKVVYGPDETWQCVEEEQWEV